MAVLRLWFVRHGESKNNAILSAAGGLGAVLYPLKHEQDPSITAKGREVATTNGERLVQAGAKFDLVFCSAMVRTMETAFFMFLRTAVIDKVYVAPHISETPLSVGTVPIRENIPLDREAQINKVGRAHGSALLDHIDWSLVGGPNGDNKATLPPNGDLFLRWLHKQDIVQELRASKGEDEVVNVGIVTHSHFLMRRETLGLDKKPSNADIWTANLQVVPGDAGPDSDVLVLTDLKGWFQETIAEKQARLGQKILKTEGKSAKKSDKYGKKIGKLTEERAASEGSGEDTAKDQQKREKKEQKYLKRLSKRVHKYTNRKDKLQAERDQYVNASDLDIEKHRAADLNEQA